MAVEVKTIKIRRGLESELDISKLLPGEFGFTTDTKRLFIGSNSGGKELVFKGEESGTVSDEQIKEAVDNYLDSNTEIAKTEDLEKKADKDYVVSVFEELKELIKNGDTDGAIAVLDQAILDLSTLA